MEREPIFDPPLWMQRRMKAGEVLRHHRARSILELGCGEGSLLGFLAGDALIRRLVGIDLRLDRVQLAHQNLQVTPRDHEFKREAPLDIYLTCADVLLLPEDELMGFDAVVSLEVIEHLQPAHLDQFDVQLLGQHRAPLVILSTPNREYNVHFGMDAPFRDADHKFEWTRQQFQDWCTEKATLFGYQIHFDGVGLNKEHNARLPVGHATQFAIFTAVASCCNELIMVKEFDFHIEFPYFDEVLTDEQKLTILTEELSISYAFNPDSLVVRTDTLWTVHRIRQIFHGDPWEMQQFLNLFPAVDGLYTILADGNSFELDPVFARAARDEFERRNREMEEYGTDGYDSDDLPSYTDYYQDSSDSDQCYRPEE